MLVSEAGGVVFKLEKGIPSYLLVRPKSGLDQWLFPKGHIESGESAAVAARREVREEAAVEAEMVGRVGTVTFDYAGHQVRVEFFLLHYVRDAPSAEGRELRWSSYEEAMRLLSFSEARDILRAAQSMHNAGT